MTLKEKLDLLSLPEEEQKKAEEKFLASLEYVTDEEIIDILDVLAEKGIKITRAREIKIVTNPVSKIKKNFDFIEEAHEPGIYSEDLNRLNSNGVDIFKRIRYCLLFNIPYKNEDGTYKDFIFKESLFQSEINNSDIKTESATIETDTLDDSVSDDVTIPEIDMDETEPINDDVEHQDIQEYMQAKSDLDNIEAQTTTFAQIKQDLEAQLAELDALRSQTDYDNDNVYRFNDIEQETYDVGRGRAA